MHTPSSDIVTDGYTEWEVYQPDWKRLAGLPVTLYVLCLPVAMVVAPIVLVVVFEYPVVAALKLTLLSVIPGYIHSLSSQQASPVHSLPVPRTDAEHNPIVPVGIS